LATVFFSIDLYPLANVFILYPLANVNVFHLKAEPTKERRQHLSKTKGKKNLPANFTILSDLENKN
jgi:hypothetical protein